MTKTKRVFIMALVLSIIVSFTFVPMSVSANASGVSVCRLSELRGQGIGKNVCSAVAENEYTDLEPLPTAPVKKVTVEPPHVNIPGGIVSPGTVVTISPSTAHVAYSINGGEWKAEYFETRITITEDTTLTVRSWVDALEYGTTYITPEATYIYKVEDNAQYPYQITNLRLTTADGSVMSDVPAGTSFIAEAEIKEVIDRSGADYFFVAAYDKEGALLNLDYVKADFPANVGCSFGFHIPAQPKEVDYVKAYVWSGFGDVTPLAESFIYLCIPEFE